MQTTSISITSYRQRATKSKSRRFNAKQKGLAVQSVGEQQQNFYNGLWKTNLNTEHYSLVRFKVM
jgi:hypothetical protein